MQNHAFIATTTCNECVTFLPILTSLHFICEYTTEEECETTLLKSYSTKVLYFTVHRAKKVVSDSPGLMDFAIGLVNSVLNLLKGQMNIFRRIKITDKYFKFLINSFGPKVSPTKWNLYKQDEVSPYLSDETYWDPAHKIKADIEKKLWR